MTALPYPPTLSIAHLCVCLCNRWSIGFADATLTVEIEKESAKHFETKASTD